MTKVQRLIFAISMTAVWGLVMPPYLYGILGIPVTFVFAFLLGGQLSDMTGMVRKNFRWYQLLPVVLLLYMMGVEFYDQWYQSSKIIGIASLVGMDVLPFLGIVIVLASLVAAVGLIYITCAVFSIPAQSKLPQCETDAADTAAGKIKPMDILFALLVALCLGMRLALNPWSGVWPDTDSAVYLYVGMMMKKGAVLYTDVFDHKGLILYLIEVLGLSLTNGSLTGVWILELVNAFVTALLIIKIVKLFCTKQTVSYLTALAVIAALTVCMLLTDGNLTEEWALPWITLALYIFMKYFVDGTYKFWHIILLGVGFAVIVFIRANMVAVWIAFLPLVLFGMIRDKKWKDIGRCALSFLIGCAIVTIPVLLFFLAEGNMKDMWESYFLFNFSYSGKAAMPVWKVMWRLFRRLTVYSGLLLAAAKLFHKNRLFQMNLWFFAVTLVLASMSGRSHAHYAIILLPTFVIPVALCLASIKGVTLKKPVAVLVSVTALFFVAEFANSFFRNGEPELSNVAVYLKENTSETDNVLMLGNNCVYYLQSGRYTKNRFCFQTPPINVSEKIYAEYQKDIEANMPDTVILTGDKKTIIDADNNYADAVRTFDAWCTEGIYVYEEQDGFGVYTLTAGE